MSNMKSFPRYFRAAAMVAAMTIITGASTTTAHALTVEEALSNKNFCWQYEGWDPQQKRWVRSEISSGEEMKDRGFLKASLSSDGKTLFERATEGTRRWHRVDCANRTMLVQGDILSIANRTIWRYPAPDGSVIGPPISVGIGSTFLFPNVQVGWAGTGTGGGVVSTFNNAEVMPTLEFDAPLATVPLGSTPVGIGLSANLMIPTNGTETRAVTAGGFSGTESFRQGLAGSIFLNTYIPLPGGTFPGPIVAQDLIVGGGVAIDHYSASAVFPGAGDFFGIDRTDVRPAVNFGSRILLRFNNIGGGARLVLPGVVMFQDFLPGSSATMPGGNAISFGTVKAQNTVAITGKLAFPFPVPGFTPPP